MCLNTTLLISRQSLINTLFHEKKLPQNRSSAAFRPAQLGRLQRSIPQPPAGLKGRGGVERPSGLPLHIIYAYASV